MFAALGRCAEGALDRYPADLSWTRRREALAVVPALVTALGTVTRAARFLGARERDVYRWKAAALSMLLGLDWKAGGAWAYPNAAGSGRALCMRNPDVRARLLAAREYLRAIGAKGAA